MDDIQKQREEFAKGAAPSVSACNSSNNTYGGLVLADGALKVIGRYACHGWLADYTLTGHADKHRFKLGDIKYILSAVMTSRGKKGQLEAYLDWLILRSPWAAMFLDKDVANVIKLGHVVDASLSSNIIGSGLIASRFFTEVYEDSMLTRHFVHKELLAGGCTEDEAFLFSHMFSTGKSSTNSYPLIFSRLQSGHSTFFANNYDASYCKNFLTNKPVRVDASLQTGGYRNGSLNSVWGNADKGEAFTNRAKSLRPIVLQHKKDLHIFRKVSAEGWEYATPKDFMSVVSQLKELIYA